MALLAVGCLDGHVYVVGYPLATATPQATPSAPQPLLRLEGHTQRVFHVAWSPLVPGLLASGSDDGTIRVWSVDREVQRVRAEAASKPTRATNGRAAAASAAAATLRITAAATSFGGSLRVSAVLVGHCGQVRPLAWSHELPTLLLSGAWDACVLGWDVEAAPGSPPLFRAAAHFADVYGLAMHPKRPFAVVTSSRDNTLR
jgi:WD40 repeat protein